MPLLNRLSGTRSYVCQQCVHRQHLPRAASRTKMSNALKSAAATDRNAQWAEQAARVQSGAQQSMLSILEERGFVKDIAGYVA
jgi:tyrosyl-tRNA synthetase